MQIKLSDDSEADILSGLDFYENQADGLGDYYLESIYAEIDSLILYAGVHRRVLGKHRALVPRFPYAIYYDIVDDIIRIWAVFDCRSDPLTAKKTLKTRVKAGWPKPSSRID